MADMDARTGQVVPAHVAVEVLVALLWLALARADGTVDVDAVGDTVVLDASETGKKAGNTRPAGGMTGDGATRAEPAAPAGRSGA
ncbi:hypothetical protein ACFRCG_12955 [Embleya sp. NPDC056575]|uniref:hypothetical protein n=1 Tax=unclassified Embleya TaxID=2699296 RepID=UPI0036B4CE39